MGRPGCSLSKKNILAVATNVVVRLLANDDPDQVSLVCVGSTFESLTGIASKGTPSSCNSHRQGADRVRGVEYSSMDNLANVAAPGVEDQRHRLPTAIRGSHCRTFSSANA